MKQIVRTGGFFITTTAAICLLLLTASSYATVHTISSFPYTASQTGTNYSDTLVIAGTNLSTSGSALRITGHDLVLYLVDDTITFGTGNGNSLYGIELSESSYNIKIVGGTIYHGGTGDRNTCLLMMGTNDVLIEGTNMRIAGTNGHCIFTPSIGPPANYNIEISGGQYRSDVTGYDNRCNYDGAAINVGTTYAGYGDFHYKIHGIRLITGPSQGICIGGRSGGNYCFAEVYACTLSSDARNYTYTDPGNTCLSAANPYQIAASRLAAGSSIHDNVILSGTNYGGSRGMIIETCAGTPENPVRIYNNYVDVHEGPNLEVPQGNVQVLRMRFGNAYVHVYDNTFIGTGGIGVGSSYGQQVTVFRITATDEEGHTPEHGIVIENNLFRANALTTGVEAIACALESFPNQGNIIRNNRFESGGTIISFGESNYGASGIFIEGDTLVRITPTTDPKTVIVGWRSYFNASEDTLCDLVYLGGASEDDITFGAGDSDYRLMRRLKVQVIGNNALPVRDATVTVRNNYGQTVFSSTTDRYGQVSELVSYRWEQNPGSDSLDYNDFTITVTKGSDSRQQTITLSAGSQLPTLTLSSTPGEDPGDFDVTPPGAISDLTASPGGVDGSIRLAWTAPGDDGSSGTASYYIIKYSTSPISESNFPLIQTAPNPPTPLSAGSNQTYTLNNLTSGEQYYFAIKTYDEENNESAISNVAVGLPGGIPTPTNTGEVIDTASGSVTLSCDQLSIPQSLIYQFALATNSSFTAAQLQTGLASGTTIQSVYTGLNNATTYYWHVRAIASDFSDTSSWSPARSFSFNNRPSTPQPVLPANGDTLTSTPITLTVSNATDADGDNLLYSFWISTNTSFTNIVTAATDISPGTNQTSASFSSFTPIPGQQYWWRCRVSDGFDYSDFSPSRSFFYIDTGSGSACSTPPSTPTITSPPNGSSVGSVNPTLCISNSTPAPGCTNPQVYTFEIYVDPNLTIAATNPVTISEGSNTTCYTVASGLETGHFYWWRVQCSNGTSVSPWAGPYSFHTPNTPPPAPVPTAPDNGGTVASLTPILSVNSVTDPDGTSVAYLFDVSPSSTFTTIVSSGQVSGHAGQIYWTVTDPLENGVQYYWRARATDGIDYSAYSSTRSFYVSVSGNNAPTTPVVQSPASGSTVDTLYPTLIVLNSDDIDGDPLTYEFELYDATASTQLGGATGISEGTTVTRWTVPIALQDNTTYRWRARSYDGKEYSAWTPLFSFTVNLSIAVNQPPTLPVPISPENGSTIITAPIVLGIQNSVDPEGDPITYDFWVYSDSLLTQVVESKFDVPEEQGGQTYVTFSFVPANNHTYWWRVRAKDYDNTTDYTDAVWFLYWDLSTGTDDYTAGTAAPPNGTVVLTERPILKAANVAVSGENYYYFEVSSDSNFVNTVVSSPPVPEESGEYTTWRVDQPLETNQEYFWRVHANDYTYSPIAKFYVEASVFASPNPVRLGETVTFHLPSEPSDLLIQTVAGETVLIKENIANEWTWDLRNASGNIISVGVYLWYFNGTSAHGKIVVKP